MTYWYILYRFNVKVDLLVNMKHTYTQKRKKRGFFIKSFFNVLQQGHNKKYIYARELNKI